MRNRLSTQRSAPPTLGLRELATSAGNRIRGEAIKKGYTRTGRKGWSSSVVQIVALIERQKKQPVQEKGKKDK